ncbi:MAG: peptidoglycan bridge formation glycyltransferase FemA/FemB family protein, partial [Anaerolineaceae bacterium]
MEEINAQAWTQWLSAYPEAHVLQSADWGRLKADFGWEPHYLAGDDCGAMVLLRKLPLGFHIAYIPKGPVGRQWSDLYPALDRLCRSKRVIFLRIEPDAWEGELVEEANLKAFAPVASKPVQPQRTIVISLTGDEGEWLKRMKQKTRYNIRLAE